MKKNVHVMVAFVSQLTQKPSNIEYRSVDGKETFSCMQTNEAAICQLQTLLQEEGGLAKIILIETDRAREKVTPDSDDWRAWMEAYGSEAMSAVEFLKAQSVRKYPNLAQVFEDSEYSKMGIEDSMRSIAAIAARVRGFADEVRRKSPEAEIVLHADMTGGFRYAAMMLLVVMQLSKYMGVRMGHVVYSDLWERRIHMTDGIHRMFDLVAGADEFQKYGSVQALEAYFERSPQHGEEFSTLFAAMRRFSDAIRICRTRVIEAEMADLAEKIRAFRQAKPASIEEEMFSHILGVIEKEYGSVIRNTSGARSDRRLDIIGWCVQKKFLQQAMTLCTEWIPEILVEKRICYTEDQAVMRQCRERGDSGAGMRSWQQEFINSYGQNTASATAEGGERPSPFVPEGDFRKASFKEMTNLLRALLLGGDRTRIQDLPPEMRTGVQNFFAAYDELYPAWRNRDLQTAYFRTRNAILDRAIKVLKPSRLKPFPYPNIPLRLAHRSDEEIFTALGIDGRKCEAACAERSPSSEKKRAEKKQESPEEKWQRREACYRGMLSGQRKLAMYTKKTTEEAIAFLRGFFFIRQGRNDTNHAAENAQTARIAQDGLENERLEAEIAAYIEKLRHA